MGAIKDTVLEMSKGGFRDLFTMGPDRHFHRVVLAYVNQMFQQISGINICWMLERWLLTIYRYKYYNVLRSDTIFAHRFRQCSLTATRGLQRYRVFCCVLDCRIHSRKSRKAKADALWSGGTSRHNGCAGWDHISPKQQRRTNRCSCHALCVQHLLCHWLAWHDLVIPGRDRTAANKSSCKCCINVR